MSVKTERITLLGTPSFKAFLHHEAKKEGISLSELVRNRCENPASKSDDDEALLLQLVSQVNASTRQAGKSLQKGIEDAEKVMAELRNCPRITPKECS